MSAIQLIGLGFLTLGFVLFIYGSVAIIKDSLDRIANALEKIAERNQ